MCKALHDKHAGYLSRATSHAGPIYHAQHHMRGSFITRRITCRAHLSRAAPHEGLIYHAQHRIHYKAHLSRAASHEGPSITRSIAYITRPIYHAQQHMRGPFIACGAHLSRAASHAGPISHAQHHMRGPSITRSITCGALLDLGDRGANLSGEA